MNIKEYLQQHPQWKKRIHGFIMHPVKTRPYWWIRVWQPFYIKKGRGSVIYSSVRKDLPPFHLFQMGKYSVVEDFSCLNNVNPEKPDVPLNKNDAFQKVQKRRVQEKR